VYVECLSHAWNYIRVCFMYLVIVLESRHHPFPWIRKDEVQWIIFPDWSLSFFDCYDTFGWLI